VRENYRPVLVEWDEEPYARKQFVVWTSDPRSAGHFAQDWLDYIERAGVRADAEIHLVPLDIRLEESQLEMLWTAGGYVENLTGMRARRMRNLLGLRGPGDALASSGTGIRPRCQTISISGPSSKY
jgi:hypothetical protein